MATYSNRRLTKGKLFGYGLAALGDSASYSFISAFLLFFLTNVAGISPVSSGIISSIGGIWNAIWSSIIGYLSDKSISRYGRRRPYMLIGAFFVSGVTVLLFTSVGAGDTEKNIYYCIMVILFWTGFSIFFIPYLAFGAELTDDYDERTVLRSYASAFNLAGGLIGMVTPTFIVAFLYGKGASLQAAWKGAGIAVAACTFLSILITWHMTRGLEKIILPVHWQENTKKKRSFEIIKMLGEYVQVIRLKPLKYLIAGSILYLAANTMTLSGRMYFLTYNMELSRNKITVVYLFAGSIGIIFIPMIIKSSKIIGKRAVFIVGVILGCAVAVISGVRGMHTLPELFVFLFFIGCGNSCYWQLFPSMIYDICEVDEFVYGQRREGIVVSIQSLSEALSAAITVFILSVILDMSGFDSKLAIQSETALKWMSYSLTFIPAVFMALAVAFVFLYPLTKKRFNLLKDAIEKKANDKEYDKNELKKII